MKLTPEMRREAVLRRFEQYTTPGTTPAGHPEMGPCLLWTGPTTGRSGYGSFKYTPVEAQKTQTLAHRFAYERVHGSVPEGKVLDHLCHDPLHCHIAPCVHRLCVNVEHLGVTTQKNNINRGRHALTRLTGVCKRGHDLNVVGSHINPSTSVRTCDECMRFLRREWQRRRTGYYERRGMTAPSIK